MVLRKALCLLWFLQMAALLEAVTCRCYGCCAINLSWPFTSYHQRNWRPRFCAGCSKPCTVDIGFILQNNKRFPNPYSENVGSWRTSVSFALQPHQSIIPGKWERRYWRVTCVSSLHWLCLSTHSAVPIRVWILWDISSCSTWHNACMHVWYLPVRLWEAKSRAVWSGARRKLHGITMGVCCRAA